MAISQKIQLSLALQNSEFDAEDLEVLTQQLYSQIGEIAEEVDRVYLPLDPSLPKELAPKGDKPEPGLFDLKITFSSLETLVKWLYQRLFGTPTEYSIEYEGLKLSVKGDKAGTLDETLDSARRFMAEVEALKKVKHDE
ncbi:hypothetical protein ACQ4M3_37750 [Leptolyngbya sp. AN03gr2]|uniref:hypothetical protein n=1 Tax=unclassified Leptolyngbya TaxID=2650499 RepID=UPI003D32239D